jgi:hypothetical protein
MEIKLGKIQKVSFGYEEYLFGLKLTLSGQPWGTCTGYYYNPSYKGDNTQYIKEMIDNVQKLLKDAKVDSVDKLLNKPIEATFEGSLLKEFRILTEVL